MRRTNVLGVWATASLCYGSLPAGLFQLYSALYFYRSGVNELGHVVALYFFWGLFFWCMYKSGALAYFTGRRVFFVNHVPYNMWLYILCGSLLGEWWYQVLGRRIVEQMFNGNHIDGFSDTCPLRLSNGQRYSLIVSSQLFLCWLWTYLRIDSLLSTQFITWELTQHALQQRFRDILNIRFEGNVVIPRRRARSWGEEVAQVLEEN